MTHAPSMPWTADALHAALENGRAYAAPHADESRVQIGHGSGGRLSAQLMRECFQPLLDKEHLRQSADLAVMPVVSGRVATSTGSYVVKPLVFRGGDIGSLAVHGTINHVAMAGAMPAYLTASFILEEGLPLELLERIVGSMADAASAAGVPVVAVDVKVVEQGQGDGIYINMSGAGFMQPLFAPQSSRAREGDRVIVSGPIGAHGIAILAARGELECARDVASDTAPLHGLVAALRDEVGDAVHALRAPGSGGVAGVLDEIACASNAGIVIEDERVIVAEAVDAACGAIGIDPLQAASEGVLVAIVDARAAGRALETLRAQPLGRDAAIVGTVVAAHPGIVTRRTLLGDVRVVELLAGDGLPRTC